jgi:MFS family permease
VNGTATRDGRLRPLLGPLTERRFALLFAGRTTSMLGGALAPVALAWAVIHLTGSPADLGLVLGASFIPQIVFLLVGGVWADRLPRHAVMVASDAVGGLAQAVVAVLLLTGNCEVWHLVVLAAVRGAASAFFGPASTAVVPQTVSAKHLQQANALLGVSRNTTAIAGAAAAGLLVAALGPGWAIAIDAATYFLGGAFLLFLRLPSLPQNTQRHFAREVADGWNEFRSRTWLWTVVTQFTFINAFSWAAFFVLGPFVAADGLGGSAGWGLVMATQAAGMLLGGFLSLRYRPKRPLFAGNLAILLITLPLALLAVPAPLLVVAAAAFIAGAGVEFFEVVWATTLQQQIAPDRLSRVSSYDLLGSYALVPLGTVLIGPLSAAIGMADTLWVAALIVLAATSAVLAVPDVRALRRVEAAAGQEPEQPRQLAAAA